jgi:hypothetical protein
VPLTIKPNALTSKLYSNNTLKLNPPVGSNLVTSATLFNIINKGKFKVKDAIIKKDANAALNNKVLNDNKVLSDNKETQEEIKRRQRIEVDNKKQQL